MQRWFIGLLAAVSANSTVDAAPRVFALTMRELTYQAEQIVLAAPADAKKIGTFRVDRCLKGKLRPGQIIAVEGVQPFFAGDSELAYKDLASACLFLTREPRSESFRLVPTGLICRKQANGIFGPLPGGEPGEFRLQLRGEGRQWDDLVARLCQDIAQVTRLQRARDLPQALGRNEALLDWIEFHQRELQESASARLLNRIESIKSALPSGEVQNQREQGWGELERLPFLWILDSGAFSDCWRACELYAAITGGEGLALNRAVYCSKSGRDFLVRVAVDDHELEGPRRRALRMLANTQTLRGGTAGLNAGEQAALIGRLLPLLRARTATTRGLTALAIREISQPLLPATKAPKESLAALIQAYKAEKPGMARDALAETVRQIGGPEKWKEITGHTHGLAAYLQDPGTRQGDLYFWLLVRSRSRVMEPPTLILERLGPEGKVLEKKTQPLPAQQATPEMWKTGWDASSPLLAQFSAKGLEAGDWRMVVEGTTGADKVKWQSEPRLFQVAAPKKPTTPQPGFPQPKEPHYPVLPPED